MDYESYQSELEAAIHAEIQEKRESLTTINEKIETAHGITRTKLEKAKMHVIESLDKLIQKLGSMESRKKQLEEMIEARVSKAIEKREKVAELEAEKARINAEKEADKNASQERLAQVMFEASQKKLRAAEVRAKAEETQTRQFIEALKGELSERYPDEQKDIFKAANLRMEGELV